MAKDLSAQSSKRQYTKDLVLLFGVPIAIVLLAAIAVYVPRLFANPTYDFIYVVCENYGCDDTYRVDANSRVSRMDRSDDYNYGRSMLLYYYDISDNSHRLLPESEAQKYRLDTKSRSPDGYMLTTARPSGGSLLWGGSHGDSYLQNGLMKKKVELSSSGEQYYSYTTTFLGWVKQ